MPRPKTKVNVNADFIIAGVFFAARNACYLLGDAHALHDCGRFASAYGLAVFCREELGKSKIWLGQWKRQLGGESVTLEDLRFGDANDHKKKLQHLGKFLNEGVFSQGEPPEPGSSEEANLVNTLSRVNARARLLDPERTHAGRLDAFFVRPGGNEVYMAYSQPRAHFDKTKAKLQLLEADVAYDRVRAELLIVAENATFSSPVLTFLPEGPCSAL